MGDGLGERLNSWKEISEYLDRNVRTLERWEKERGLPIRRVPGGRGRSVFAYTGELDRWLLSAPAEANGEIAESSPAPPSMPDAATPASRRTTVAVVAVVFVLLLTGIIAVTYVTAKSDITRLAFNEGELSALDSRGHVKWRQHFDEAVTDQQLRRGWDVLTHLDGDGTRDVVVAVQHHEDPQGHPSETLYGFSSDGRRLWTRQPSDTIGFASGAYAPPWNTVEMVPFQVNGETRIAWIQHHHTWWPSLLTILDTRGRQVSRFVNSGWLLAVNASVDGKTVVTGGVTNASDAYALAVFDSSSITGSSPEEPGSRFQCTTCGSGGPRRYFVMPRLEVNAALRNRLIRPDVAMLPGGGMSVHLVQAEAEIQSADAIYEFSSTWEPVRAQVSDTYWDWHKRLTSEGRIDHPVERCPEREGLPVRWFDPATGWHAQIVKSW